MALGTPKMDKLKMGTKLVDTDVAIGMKQGLKIKKQKKSQGSSRYRAIGTMELSALPLLKGKDATNWRMINYFMVGQLQ